MERGIYDQNYWNRKIVKGIRSIYTQYILDHCSKRGGKWASDVSSRIVGDISDLHAADARYHKNCYRAFFTNRQSAPTENRYGKDVDQPINKLIKAVQDDQEKIWTSVELQEMYELEGGKNLSCGTLISELEECLGSDIVVMSCNGYATQIAHRKEAAKLFRTAAKSSDLDEDELWIRRIGKRIKQECLAIHYDSFHYTVNANKKIASESVSETLERLLAAISVKLETPSLTALLVGNMITAAVTYSPASSFSSADETQNRE